MNFNLDNKYFSFNFQGEGAASNLWNPLIRA